MPCPIGDESDVQSVSLRYHSLQLYQLDHVDVMAPIYAIVCQLWKGQTSMPDQLLHSLVGYDVTIARSIQSQARRSLGPL